jgi:serine/threonine protein kinase
MPMEVPALPRKLAGRYEIKQVLGEGGMGLVYRAYDAVIRRDVALKTIRDIPEPTALQLFHKECDVLASMSHPNIVEIFDIGEFEEDGKRKPYFVMPLLPGTTLDRLIRDASHRLTVERTVEIISQVCRGLQAAHERGLVHRDLKPSNIFVMEDDSVKIIDFGVAHITDAHSTMGQKGTLLYMSPEQIEMKPLSPLSDIFSLSVVCYEALTGRQPFRRSKQEEIVDAILHQTPPPAADLNSSVNDSISRVVHKGMAKQAWHRFSGARDFGDALNKAMRNEPIEFFDPVRIRPRLERATKALEAGDYQFAAEILGELEAEGHIDSSLDLLRKQLDGAVKQKTIQQLLDGAKARFEEEEDPLALQKLQEALQLDPENATALALKRQIESRRSERQIENWYRLASQHSQNHAYHHAREALQNVLQLKPRESRALQLLTEIDRREQEYNKLRQEKVQLHRAAMEAWQKGEVSSALTKLAMVLELDRLAPDSANPERSSSYQSFYNKVRSEHDSINNGYAEARKCLQERNLVKAGAVCDSFLTKYPNNALFQALKFDIEEQRRQELSAYIASVDRRVETEPDLDKRVNVLREALALYPDETHFERALQLVQDKRDLVNSIVAKAHAHEEQGAFNDALNDWEVLRTIYGLYPGLKHEVERLLRRREQQARVEAKAHWVEQIDDCRHSNNYSRALELLQQAGAEFPNDSELRELETTVREGMKNAAEVQRLICAGQDLCGESKFEEGLRLLRQACALDEHNVAARSAVSSALVEQARLVLDTNWRHAEQLIQQALELNPGHTAAKSMRTLVQDKKREQFVDECVSGARRLQAAADFANALARIEKALSSYPNEARLLQLRETLRKETTESQRRRHLEELRKLASEAERTGKVSAKRAFGERARSMANTYAEDADFLSAIKDIQPSMTLQPPSQPRAAANQTSELPNATRLFSPVTAPKPGLRRLPSIPSVSLGDAATASKSARRASLPPSPRSSFPASGSLARLSIALRALWQKLAVLLQRALSHLASIVDALPKRTKIILGSGLCALLLFSIVLVKLVPGHRRSAIPANAVPIQVDIRTLPSGATILINGEVKGESELQLNLTPGNYEVEARLEGYESQTVGLETKAGAPVPLELTLTPMAAVLRVIADGGIGKVWFDDQPEAAVNDAQWSTEKVAAGQHRLKFTAERAEAAFAFESKPGSLMTVEGPVSANGLRAVVVSNISSRLRVYGSYFPATVSLDGQPAIDIPEGGLEMTALSGTSHKLSVSRGNDQQVVNVDVGTAPALTAFLESDRNVGSLWVVTGEDEVQVFVNNRLYKSTRGGHLQIPDLEPREYSVRVSKRGRPDPPEQHVRVQKGEQARVVFTLQPPVPGVSSLSIQGGTAGSEIFIDEAVVGAIQPDGSFRLSHIIPGDHVIELHKPGFNTKRMQRHFNAGSEVALLAAEADLDMAMGQLRVTFSPPDSEVTLTGADGRSVKVASDNPLTLRPGSYTLAARAADRAPRTSSVEIVAGDSKILNLGSLVPGGMDDWEVPGGWRHESDMFIRKGGNFVLYRASPTSGTFRFSVVLLKGHKLQWVLNYVDEANYLLFQMDENYFYRTQVVNGETIQGVKIPHKTAKKQFRTFQIVVSPGQVLQQIWEANAWVSLDTWGLPGANLSSGKFGFLIPGNDELGLSNFDYYGNLKLR